MKKILTRLWYKISNKSKYQNFKIEENLRKRIEFYNSKIKPKITEFEKSIKNNKEINFSHSGHMGDIIYSLPVVKKIAKEKICNLYIVANKPMEQKYFNHPSGKFYLDEKVIKMLLPLLNEQKYLNKVEIFNNQKIHVDMDLFRSMPANIQYYSPRWFFHLTGIHVNLEEPFLQVNPHKIINGKIVVLRTFRYRNCFINYKFLNEYENIIFVGLKDEYDDLKKQVRNLEFYDCKDFLEMAEIIKASKFFIGNEAPGYAIAEALKVPRLLEASPDFPVIFPIGEKSFDFYHQMHFEKFFKELYKNT